MVERAAPVVTTVVPVREDFPTWVLVPVGIVVLALVVGFFVFMNRTTEDSANSVNVRVTANRPVDNRAGSRTDTSVVTVPPATETRTVTVPPTQTTTTTVPALPGAADKGVMVIDAKISSRNGAPQSVRNEKFYLLDKDLESILSDADLEPIEGQNLTNSLGMSVLYPDKYGDFHRSALSAINKHIKYSVQTDSAGKAQMSEIKPDNYYLFGVTKTGKGFAVWSSPVMVNAGQNALNLSPQPLTEIEDRP
jgi:hypothetical protein